MLKKPTQQENEKFHVHDRFFKAAISHIQVAKQLFQQYLPAHIRERIDFDTFAISQGKHTRSNFKQSEVDAVYQARLTTGDRCYCYAHVEQQRDPERYLPLRQLSYKCDILTQHSRQYPGEPLPPIFSIVIYNGTRPYPFETNLLKLFNDQKLAEESLLNPLEFIDLPTAPDDEISQRPWSGAMLGLLKHISQSDLPDYIREYLCNALAKIEKEEGITYIMSMWTYIIKGSELINKTEFEQLMRNAVSSDTQEEIMTLAERIKQEGIEEGIEERNITIAKKMLEDGSDPKYIAYLTDLSLDRIHGLKITEDQAVEDV